MDKGFKAAHSKEKRMETSFSSTRKEEQEAPALVKAAGTGIQGTKEKQETGKTSNLKKDENKEDVLLWARIKAGDTEALGALYDLYIDVLYPYGFSLTKDKVLVMDSIHDLFLDIFKYRKKLADSPQIKFYLLRSLKRKLFKKGRVSRTIFDLKDEKNLFHLDLFENSVEKSLIENENVLDKQKLINSALSGLTKRQKKAVKLKFYDGKSYEEISLLMDISIETSRTLIYRSITSLRKKLAAALLFFF